MKYSTRSNFLALFTNKRGTALVEFALVAPLILVLFFGTVELSRYIIIMQKVERSAYVLSNMTVQYKQIASHIDDPFELDVNSFTTEIFPQFKKSMDPYIDDGDRVAIVTSMTRVNNGNSNNSININWQVVGGGSFGTGVKSVINGFTPSQIPADSENGAAAGTNPTFPFAADTKLMDGALSAMVRGENMIVVEVFYNYKPIVSGILGRLGAVSMAQTTIKSAVYARPRQGDLNSLIRPAAPPPPPPPVPDPIETTTCVTNPISNPIPSCNTSTDTDTCTDTASCTVCADQEVCTTCTSLYNTGIGAYDPATCAVSSTDDINCTTTTTESPTLGCTVPPPPPPPPEVTVTCVTNPIGNPTPSCSSSTDTDTCTDTTSCTICTDQEVCTTCTTPFGGSASCVVSSTSDVNCTTTTTTSPTPSCTVYVPPPPPAPPVG